ncbi:2-oxoacid ferredoxin oxidoreductase [Candidatus Dojkabacteria bacterium]|nr:2-oxoacid ferredoxin oxidoreductase [Candidatus Dojkabacteria bacterium]
MTNNSKCVKYNDYFSDQLYTWCTNCGNYALHSALKRALVAEKIAPKDTLMVFDIGCHGNGADKIDAYTVHGIHGRVIPFAAGAQLANRNMKVFAFGGDGGILSEGINHLVHAIRCDFDLVFVLHNNRNYGLTTGQASATTPKGFEMNSAPNGVTEEPINPTEFVLSLDPTFVARGFSGNIKKLTQIFKQAINHQGFSFVEVLQDCPTYNSATPHNWYLERVIDVDIFDNYDRSDIKQAKKICKDMAEKIATGVLYKNEDSDDYYTRQPSRKDMKSELVEEVQQEQITELLEEFR